MKNTEQAYWAGFIQTCEAAGVDPQVAVKQAQIMAGLRLAGQGIKALAMRGGAGAKALAMRGAEKAPAMLSKLDPGKAVVNAMPNTKARAWEPVRAVSRLGERLTHGADAARNKLLGAKRIPESIRTRLQSMDLGPRGQRMGRGDNFIDASYINRGLAGIGTGVGATGLGISALSGGDKAAYWQGFQGAVTFGLQTKTAFNPGLRLGVLRMLRRIPGVRKAHDVLRGAPGRRALVQSKSNWRAATRAADLERLSANAANTKSTSIPSDLIQGLRQPATDAGAARTKHTALTRTLRDKARAADKTTQSARAATGAGVGGLGIGLGSGLLLSGDQDRSPVAGDV